MGEGLGERRAQAGRWAGPLGPPQALRPKLREPLMLMVTSAHQGPGRGYLPSGPSRSFQALGEGRVWDRGTLKQTAQLCHTGGRARPGEGAEPGWRASRQHGGTPEDHACLRVATSVARD